MNRTTCVLAAAIAGSLLLTSLPANAQRKSAQQTRAEKTQELPVCTKPLGTITVLEPETRWWSE